MNDPRWARMEVVPEWHRGKTEGQMLADEEAWQRECQHRHRLEKEAFRARGFQPPRASQVNGPPLDWKRWCALLDGVPVGSCWAWDVDAGWVEVWVLVEKNAGGTVATRSATEDRRRLSGKVTPVSCEEWRRLKEERGVVEVWSDDLQGEPVPGTALRTPEEHAAIREEFRKLRTRGER